MIIMISPDSSHSWDSCSTLAAKVQMLTGTKIGIREIPDDPDNRSLNIAPRRKLQGSFFFSKLETCGDMGQACDNLFESKKPCEAMEQNLKFESYHRTKRGTCIARLPKGDIIHYDKI